MLLEAKFVTLFVCRLLLLLSAVFVSAHHLASLDHYGSGGWGPPTPSSGPRWGPIPGSSSSTPGPPPVLDSPYRITCPVHSPYRFRFANGGQDYYGRQVVRFDGEGCSIQMTSSCRERHSAEHSAPLHQRSYILVHLQAVGGVDNKHLIPIARTECTPFLMFEFSIAMKQDG